MEGTQDSTVGVPPTVPTYSLPNRHKMLWYSWAVDLPELPVGKTGVKSETLNSWQFESTTVGLSAR